MSTSYYGSKKPEKFNKGDVWFKTLKDKTIEIIIL